MLHKKIKSENKFFSINEIIMIISRQIHQKIQTLYSLFRISVLYPPLALIHASLNLNYVKEKRNYGIQVMEVSTLIESTYITELIPVLFNMIGMIYFKAKVLVVNDDDMAVL